MKLNKTLATLFMITLAISSLTACSGEDEPTVSEKTSTVEATAEKSVPVANEEEAAPEPESESEPEPEVVRDLGGLHVILGSVNNVIEPEIKGSSYEEALWDYRHEMMEKHNFTIEQKAVAKRSDMLELMSTSMMTGEPAAQAFYIASNYVTTAMVSGLCYDLATLDEIDLDHWKWDPAVIDYMTIKGSTYGVAVSQSPSGFIYFNKRLFEEAGLDPELPYDLQASGEWTWDAFDEISAKLSRDLDGDGINDTYATNSHSRIFDYALIANGGQMVDIDENRMFINTINIPENVEAFTWAADYLSKGYDLAGTHGSSTDEELFMTGKIAMMPLNKGAEFKFKDMADDFGMVLFPKGPKVDDYRVSGVGAGWFIPSTYSPEEAADIAFALNIWTNEPPGYDSEDDWMMEEYKNFRDDRAVEETLAMMREPGVLVLNYRYQIPGGVPDGNIYRAIQNNEKTPVEAFENAVGEYDAVLATANKVHDLNATE